MNKIILGGTLCGVGVAVVGMAQHYNLLFGTVVGIIVAVIGFAIVVPEIKAAKEEFEELNQKRKH